MTPSEKPGHVSVSDFSHSDSKVTDGMMANSENTRCPARKGAEGQPRTKQEGESLPGVRNEHVPSAKAKMCSELGGNVETDTETISGSAHDYTQSIGQKLTECHTNHIYGVVDMNRFFRPTPWIDTANQDGKVMRIH